jgi:hypothetical protein
MPGAEDSVGRWMLVGYAVLVFGGLAGVAAGFWWYVTQV